VNTLLELSLRGSLVAGLVWLLDRTLAGKMAARGRHWWWALVPVAFLVSIPRPFFRCQPVFRLPGLLQRPARWRMSRWRIPLSLIFLRPISFWSCGSLARSFTCSWS
jgi:hypothetical protein